MRPISQKIRKQIDERSFYKQCCIIGSLDVSMEHCFIYAGKQINELWAIMPLDRWLNSSHPPVEAKEMCQLLSLHRTTKEDLAKYPKKNWRQIFTHLNNKYGNNDTYKTALRKQGLAGEKIQNPFA